MEDNIGLVFVNSNNKILLSYKTVSVIPLLDIYCKSSFRKTIENYDTYNFSKKLDPQTLVYVYEHEHEINIDLIKFVFSWVSSKVKNIDFVNRDLSAKQWIDVMTFADFLQIDEFFVNNNLPPINNIISEFYNLKCERAFLYYETEFLLLAKNYITKTLLIKCTCNHKLIERCNKFIINNSKIFLLEDTYHFIIEKLNEIQLFYKKYEKATNESYIEFWKDDIKVVIGKLLKDVKLCGDINNQNIYIDELFNSHELLSELTRIITNDTKYKKIIDDFQTKHWISDDNIFNYSLLTDSDKKDMFYYYYYVKRYYPENKHELKHCICDVSMYAKLNNFVQTDINLAKCIFLSMDRNDFVKLIRISKGSNKLLNLSTFEDLILLVDELKNNREYANSKKLTPDMKIVKNEQKILRQEFNKQQKRIEQLNAFRLSLRSLNLY
jgi:hypothetical protein